MKDKYTELFEKMEDEKLEEAPKGTPLDINYKKLAQVAVKKNRKNIVKSLGATIEVWRTMVEEVYDDVGFLSDAEEQIRVATRAKIQEAIFSKMMDSIQILMQHANIWYR